MPSFTPKLQLETLFVLDGDGRTRATREPNPTRGPAFSLVRDKRPCAWALSADVPSELADDARLTPALRFDHYGELRKEDAWLPCSSR